MENDKSVQLAEEFSLETGKKLNPKQAIALEQYVNALLIDARNARKTAVEKTGVSLVTLDAILVTDEAKKYLRNRVEKFFDEQDETKVAVVNELKNTLFGDTIEIFKCRTTVELEELSAESKAKIKKIKFDEFGGIESIELYDKLQVTKILSEIIKLTGTQTIDVNHSYKGERLFDKLKPAEVQDGIITETTIVRE